MCVWGAYTCTRVSELRLQAGAGNRDRLIEDLLAKLWPSVLETVTGAGMGVPVALAGHS